MATLKHCDIVKDSIVDLRVYLKKLKKEEMELEIALTLRKFPEVEDTVVRLVTCVTELGITEKSMKMESVNSSGEEVDTQKASLDNIIKALTAKLVTLRQDTEAGKKLHAYYTEQIKKAEHSKYTVGLSKKNLKFLDLYESRLRQLLEVYEQCKKIIFPEGFVLEDHVPKLQEYLLIAHDLVRLKG